MSPKDPDYGTMPQSTSTKIGHGLAKVLGIRLDYRDETGANKLTRGESVFSVDSSDSYVEREPTAADWIREITPTGRQLGLYVYSLFPFLHWITRYNAQWLAGDLVAGITIGAVVVPQGMAYAGIAELAPQFGLYSSFMGVLIYWFFATSKDITIGPVAVMSKITGNIVLKVRKERPDIPGNVVASALAIIAGAIICFFGLIRIGWLVEFISLTAISAFMTGSAINIAVGQVPTLMGIPNPPVDNRAATYQVVIGILKHLNATRLDAALGFTALFGLYAIRFAFNQLAKRYPSRKKTWFFCNTLRTVFIILLYTLVSWLVNRHLPSRTSKSAKLSPFKILGPVPRGFQDAAVPTIDVPIIKLFVSELPVTVIVLLIEHISISKSFGRVNNYTIDPSQEMVAIGVTNLLGPFLGAYPATGSFSRTAIKSKAGVRTPFAGVITAVVVLLAIYALPVVFFYIPNSALAAVIIHAVGDLITPPNTVYQFWRVSPVEVFIFFAGVIVTVFASIEIGVYVTMTTSLALLLWRVFKAQGRFMGRVKIHSVIGDHLIDEQDSKPSGIKINSESDPDQGGRNIFLPIDHGDGSNPNIQAQHPYPGVFVYRFSENFNYLNANHYTDFLVATVFKETRRTNPHSYPRLGDRPWNNPGPRRDKPIDDDSHKPTLKAIILDFSSVNNMDLTSTQNLIDVRNQLDRWTAPERVQWHIACCNNRWTKRALVAAGFGYPSYDDGEHARWKPIFSVAELGGSTSAAAEAEWEASRRKDIEAGHKEIDSINRSDGSSSDREDAIRKSPTYNINENVKVAVVQGLNRPFFHIDLTSAVQSAIHNIEVHSSKHTEEQVLQEEVAEDPVITERTQADESQPGNQWR